MQLVSKIQYKNYETGEFSNIAARTLEETYVLIDTFPWTEQRNLTDVQLTCPSVTIERDTDSFLKIGPYFSGKFCLYLYENGSLYEKSITNLPDCKDTISYYFNNKDIRPEFEKISLAFNSRKHFVTDPFEYCITGKHIVKFLIFPEIILIVPLQSLLIFSLISKPVAPGVPALLVTIVMSMLFIGFNLYLFFNYYFYSKDKYLRVSKGQDEFDYGSKGDYEQYSKKEIKTIVMHRHRNQRVLWSDYVVFEINFKNGDQIVFPSLLLKEHLLTNKFANQRIKIKHKFLPTIPSK